MKLKYQKLLITSIATTMIALVSMTQRAEAVVSYYIGVDSRETLTSGTYNGLANPNFERLTFLYAHWSAAHYHAKGTIVYTGPDLGAATATMTSTSNFLPEGANPPLVLQMGTGVYAGKWINVPSANPFSTLTIEDTGKLATFPPGSPEQIMFDSAGGRWNGSLVDSDVHMKLIGFTPGLNFGTASNPMDNPFADDEGLHLEDAFSLTLNPWVDEAAATGFYSAQFQFVDEAGTFGDSGIVEFRFQVIPEPSSTLMAMLASTGFLLRRRRN
jgi:hypothetical protein